MSYSTPKTDWDAADAVGSTDFNRIESNIKALKDEAVTINGVKTFEGDNVHNGDETFNGSNIHNGSETFISQPSMAAGNKVNGYVHGTVTENAIFDAMSPFLPNIGDSMIISGSSGSAISTAIVVYSRAERTGASIITLYSLSVSTSSGSVFSREINDGDSSTLLISLSW